MKHSQTACLLYPSPTDNTNANKAGLRVTERHGTAFSLMVTAVGVSNGDRININATTLLPSRGAIVSSVFTFIAPLSEGGVVCIRELTKETFYNICLSLPSGDRACIQDVTTDSDAGLEGLQCKEPEETSTETVVMENCEFGGRRERDERGYCVALVGCILNLALELLFSGMSTKFGLSLAACVLCLHAMIIVYKHPINLPTKCDLCYGSAIKSCAVL